MDSIKSTHACLNALLLACEERSVKAKCSGVDRAKIRAMHANGQSVRAIATEVGISKSLVANILNSHKVH
jgi:DNA invertase Pin-like site-specific DNA recombinase